MAGGGGLRSYLVVVGGFLVYLTLGSIYSFGNLTTYFTSYIRARSVPHSLTYAESSWVLALSFGCQGGSMALGGLISIKIGPRWTTLLGSGLMSLGVFLTYFTIKWSFILCLLSYSILFGCGVGIAYTSPVSCAMKWHPQHKGLVNGMTLAGFGLGAFVFSPVMTAFINPNNKTPDLPAFPGSLDRYFSEAMAADVLDRVPQCFLLLAGIYVIMQVTGCCMLSDPPKDEETECLLMEDSDNRETIQKTKGAQSQDVHPREVIKDKSFYLIWLMFLLNSETIVIIGSLYKAFGQTFIYDDSYLTIISSLVSVCNAVGRIVWGQIIDKTSFRMVMIIISTAVCVMILLFDISAVLQSKVMYTIWGFALMFLVSGNFVLVPTAMSKAYGAKYLTVNLGLAFSSQLVTGITSAILASTIVDSVGWFGLYLTLGAFSFVSAVLAIMFNLRGSDGSYI